jgi:hypothetical protein
VPVPDSGSGGKRRLISRPSSSWAYVDVRGGDLLQHPGVVEHAHRAPVGDLRDGDLRDRGQGLLVVQRGVEDRPGAGEEVRAHAALALGLEQRPALGDVDDRDDDPGDRPVGVGHRRERGVPVPRPAGVIRGRQLAIDGGLAAGQDVLAARQDALDWPRVEGGERLVDAHEAQIAIHERQAHRRRREDGVEQTQGALGAVVQARVVDGDGAALRERVGEDEVGRDVVAPRARREQRHRAEDPSARGQRDDHVGLRREALDQLAVALLDRLVHGRAHVGGQDRLTGLGHTARLRGALLGAPVAPDLQERLLEARIGVAAGELALAVAGVHQQDAAPVGDVGHGEARHLAQGGLVVQRPCQQCTGAGEELERLLRADDRPG